MKLVELKKGEMFALMMTGAEKDKYKEFFDDFLNIFENNGDEE